MSCDVIRQKATGMEYGQTEGGDCDEVMHTRWGEPGG